MKARQSRAELVAAIVHRVLGRVSSDLPWVSQKPIREELFGAERLEEHARSLAIAQTVTPRPTKGRPLSGRLAGNCTVLLHAYRTISRSIGEGRAITPAAEWLADNY
jgi:cyclic beta-1,2-glucan synthetase